MSVLHTVKFKHRDEINPIDKYIAEVHTKGPKFDTDVVLRDGTLVSAHRFVLTLYSKYFAKLMQDAEFDGKIVGKYLQIASCSFTIRLRTIHRVIRNTWSDLLIFRQF